MHRCGLQPPVLYSNLCENLAVAGTAVAAAGTVAAVEEAGRTVAGSAVPVHRAAAAADGDTEETAEVTAAAAAETDPLV